MVCRAPPEKLAQISPEGLALCPGFHVAVFLYPEAINEHAFIELQGQSAMLSKLCLWSDDETAATEQLHCLSNKCQCHLLQTGPHMHQAANLQEGRVLQDQARRSTSAFCKIAAGCKCKVICNPSVLETIHLL